MKKHILNWVFLLRIALGLSLFIKGIQFVRDKSLIRDVFNESLILQHYFWLQTIIPWMNLLCGVFIILGLFTRIAVGIQIPILIGAIIFVHARNGVYAGQSGFLFSIFVLLALIFFMFKGSGPFSWDEANKKEESDVYE